ncbi:MAG: DEAD/DEAH box helicase [Cytophagia bacterium]|nr:DEAD/DEAH box helicase [Cytophagia bacterium]
MSTFQALGLSQALVETITKMGFESPTPIQEKAIPVLLEGDGRDMVALAQTGTGKTAAFGLPLIELLDEEVRTTQALVLAPTRELCLQITNDLENFSKNVKPLNIVAIYGGASIMEQIKKVKRGAHIVVATPGRLMDMMERKAVNISSIRFVVLDEADEMLNMGFKEDIDTILADTPETKNVWLFSATMPREVRAIASHYMTDPAEVTMGTKNQGNVNIEHQYVLVDERDRYPALKRIVDYNLDIFAVIFCRTKIDTQKVAESLIKDGYNADALHGDLTQQQRDKVMRNFKEKTLQFLVATDVAARGIDVSNITHVIHMNLPDEIEFYTHRSGRTARAGKKGISIAIITKREVGKIRQIEKVVNTKFERKQVPTGPEGKMDGLDAGKFLGMVCDRCGVKGDAIGRIDLKGAYSFIEVDKEVSKLVQDNLHGMEYKGRMVRVEVTSGAGEGGGASRGGSRSGGSRERSYSSSSSSRGRSYGGDSRNESRGGGESRSSDSRKRSYSGDRNERRPSSGSRERRPR